MAERPPHTPTHYDILGVRPTASPQQIRRAFRDRSKLYHPDTTTLPPAEATEKFQQLNEAYGVLSSPDRRWTYDKQVGYSRISVMQPLESLYGPRPTSRRKTVSNVYLDPNDRPLSAGEIFALFILGLTFVACLVLVVTIGFTRGEVALTPEAMATSETKESSASVGQGQSGQEIESLPVESLQVKPEPLQPNQQAPLAEPPPDLSDSVAPSPQVPAASSVFDQPAQPPSDLDTRQIDPSLDHRLLRPSDSRVAPPLKLTWL
jgi:hypothetical protein